MADIYKQPRSQNWYIRFTDELGRDIRKTTRSKDRTAAQLILAEELKAVELRRMGIGAASPLGMHSPIEDLIAKYIRSIEADGLCTSWVIPIRRRLLRMVKDLRIHTLADVTTNRLKEYIADHPTAKAHQTKLHYITAMRGFCKWAMDQTPPLISTNPAEGATPKLTRRNSNIHGHRQCRRPFWTHEIPMFLNARPDTPREQILWDTRRKHMYTVALGTGLRRGTLKQLTKSSIRLDVANPHIIVPAEITKSGRQFTMSLEDPVVI